MGERRCEGIVGSDVWVGVIWDTVHGEQKQIRMGSDGAGYVRE